MGRHLDVPTAEPAEQVLDLVVRAGDTLAKISSETSGCRLAGGQELVEGDRQVSYPDAGGVVRGVDDPADGEDAEQAGYAYLARVLVHPYLGELRPEAVHRELLGVRVVGHLGADLQPLGRHRRRGRQPLPQEASRLEDRRTPARDSR